MTCCKCNVMLLAIEAIYIPGRRGGGNNKLSAAAQQTTRRIQSVKHLAAHYEYFKKKIQLKNLKYLRKFCENLRKSRAKLFGCCCYNTILQLYTLNIVSNIKSSIDFLVHIVAFQKCHWHINEY